MNFNSEIDFDIIYAKNVFQYLDNPIEGFLKSHSLLKDSGSLICSLSAFSYYSDIDNIRKDLLKLGYSYENKEDIEESYNIVSGLNGFHPARLRMVKGDNFIDKNDFIFRFLCPIHSSFSIRDIFGLCNSSDFYFQSWYSNALYYPSSLLRKDSSRHSSLYNKINSIDIPDKWDIVCDIFKSSNDRYNHNFILRKDINFKNFELKLLNNEEAFVSLRKHFVIKKINESQEMFAISSNYKRRLSPGEIKITDLLNKRLKLRDIYKSNDLDLDQDEINSIIISLLETSIINLSL